MEEVVAWIRRGDIELDTAERGTDKLRTRVRYQKAGTAARAKGGDWW